MSVQNVTGCICHSRSFQEVKEYAEEHNISTLQELQKVRYCSCSCGLCSPYVELVLETGQTAFAPGAYYKRGNND